MSSLCTSFSLLLWSFAWLLQRKNWPKHKSDGKKCTKLCRRDNETLNKLGKLCAIISKTSVRGHRVLRDLDVSMLVILKQLNIYASVVCANLSITVAKNIASSLDNPQIRMRTECKNRKFKSHRKMTSQIVLEHNRWINKNFSIPFLHPKTNRSHRCSRNSNSCTDTEPVLPFWSSWNHILMTTEREKLFFSTAPCPSCWCAEPSSGNGKSECDVFFSDNEDVVLSNDGDDRELSVISGSDDVNLASMCSISWYVAPHQLQDQKQFSRERWPGTAMRCPPIECKPLETMWSNKSYSKASDRCSVGINGTEWLKNLDKNGHN